MRREGEIQKGKNGAHVISGHLGSRHRRVLFVFVFPILSYCVDISTLHLIILKIFK